MGESIFAALAANAPATLESSVSDDNFPLSFFDRLAIKQVDRDILSPILLERGDLLGLSETDLVAQKVSASTIQKLKNILRIFNAIMGP